jgi:hypothetical protein
MNLLLKLVGRYHYLENKKDLNELETKFLDNSENYIVNIEEQFQKQLDNMYKTTALDIQREIKEISLQNEEKKKIINTLKVENEFIKMRDQLKQEEMKRERERELSLNNKLNNQNNKSTQMKVYPMKRSVNYSVGKIKRNFDMNDPNNNAFVHNIKTKIQ